MKLHIQPTPGDNPPHTGAARRNAAANRTSPTPGHVPHSLLNGRRVRRIGHRIDTTDTLPPSKDKTRTKHPAHPFLRTTTGDAHLPDQPIDYSTHTQPQMRGRHTHRPPPPSHPPAALSHRTKTRRPACRALAQKSQHTHGPI